MLACITLPGGILLAAEFSTDQSDNIPGGICPTQNLTINQLPYTPINYNTPQSEKLLLAETLGWVVATEPCSHCGGYFMEPVIPGTSVHLPPISSTQTTISSDQGLGHLNNGISTLSGNLVVTQPGRIVTANQGQLKIVNGNYTDVYLAGHVTLHEQGKFLVADKGHINLQNKNTELYNVIYRFFIPKPNEPTAPVTGMSLNKIAKSLNAWGSASKLSQGTDKVMQLVHTTYSTCPPISRAWDIESRLITLNKATGRGTAYDATLYTHGVPILYAPYFNFPIDNRRQSGFLFPTYTSSSVTGIGIGFPYYLNLAPNYDDTITPRYFTKSGIQLSNQFRYLTPSSNGIFSFSFLPDDRAFAAFQNQAQNLPVNDGFFGNVALSRLEDDSDNRSIIAWQNNTQFDDHWSSTVNYTRVSDDYYLEDFGATPAEIISNQLLQQGIINYNSDYWNFSGRLQSYQTLHPVNQAVTINQYSSLPQFDLNSNFPIINNQFNAEFSGELVDFTNTPNPGSPILPPEGTRLNLVPGAIFPLRSSAGYLTPQLQFDFTQYSVRNQPDNFSDNINRAIPIFDIDSGLYFDRDLSLFGTDYDQTLEPRLYYLYVPYHNQDDIPIFDTYIQPFTYDQLFRDNRFSGIDRIGDADQISVGLSSRFLNQDTGEQKFQAGIGDIVYFENRQVTLCSISGCTDNAIINNMLTPIASSVGTTSPTENTSPIVGQGTYNLNHDWNASVNVAWDPNTHLHTQNAGLNFQYNPWPDHIINVGYNFLRYGDALTAEPPTSPVTIVPNVPASSGQNNLSQPGFSFVWPILDQWQAVGSWNYNLSHGHSQAYFVGAEYDSCCWAVRLVQAHIFSALSARGSPLYNNTIYLQWQLKGLGNIGTNDPTNILLSSVPGYQDNFGEL